MAASRAAVPSATLASATCAITSPVDGSSTANVLPPPASRHSPPMNSWLGTWSTIRFSSILPMLARSDPSHRMTWWHSIRMDDRRHGLNPVDEAWSRSDDHRIAVNGPNLDARQLLRGHGSVFDRAVESVAAGSDDGDIGRFGTQRGPFAGARCLSRVAANTDAAGSAHLVGDPVPAGEQRIDPCLLYTSP